LGEPEAEDYKTLFDNNGLGGSARQKGTGVKGTLLVFLVGCKKKEKKCKVQVKPQGGKKENKKGLEKGGTTDVRFFFKLIKFSEKKQTRWLCGQEGSQKRLEKIDRSFKGYKGGGDVI